MLPLYDVEPTAAKTKFARDVVKLASIVKLERKNNVSLSADESAFTEFEFAGVVAVSSSSVRFRIEFSFTILFA